MMQHSLVMYSMVGKKSYLVDCLKPNDSIRTLLRHVDSLSTQYFPLRQTTGIWSASKKQLLFTMAACPSDQNEVDPSKRTC